MPDSPIQQAIKQICEEKNISYEAVLETIQAALAVAYRKDFGKPNENIEVLFNPETGEAQVYDMKMVTKDALKEEYDKEMAELEAKREAEKEAGEGESGAESAPPKPAEIPKKKDADENEETSEEEEEPRWDPRAMISLSDAQKEKKDAKIGDEIRTQLFPPEAYGRMAAQTAKQVIIQRLREAEREMLFAEFKDKEGKIITGTVQRIEGRTVFVDLGSATAILQPSEQVRSEMYQPGMRLKFYLLSVDMTSKGPEIHVSRSHPEMVKQVFSIEVPEIVSGVIEIKAVAREGGVRSKIAVLSHEANVDPVGSCVGQRGSRVQTVISELGGEKIDIIEYDEDPIKFIINALSPAKVLSVKTNEAERTAVAEVKEDQLSLAIGKGGQNVRLAAKLSGWKIDIMREDSDEVVSGDKKEEGGSSADEASEGEDAPKEEDAAKDAPEQTGEAAPDAPAEEAKEENKEPKGDAPDAPATESTTPSDTPEETPDGEESKS